MRIDRGIWGKSALATLQDRERSREKKQGGGRLAIARAMEAEKTAKIVGESCQLKRLCCSRRRAVSETAWELAWSLICWKFICINGGLDVPSGVWRPVGTDRKVMASHRQTESHFTRFLRNAECHWIRIQPESRLPFCGVGI